MPSINKLLQAAAGNAGESLYVEDVFSTYLYTGTGAVKTITNGIDLDGEGGVVWIKQRSGTENHVLAYDENKFLSSNTTDAVNTNVNYVQSFNSNGFQVGAASPVTASGYTFVSWTFRKAEKFFDVVTWTGDGTNDREISHNLGSVPGFIIIKSISNSTDWITYHRDYTYPLWIRLNSTDAESTTYGDAWSSSNPPTSTGFTLGSGGFGDVNYSGRTYVAYVFAHDAGGFGDDGDENIITCGSYTGNGSTDGPEINCGFEPQWLLIKNTTNGGNWVLMDAMRGMPVGDEATVLLPNASGAESSYANLWGVDLQATGFKVNVSQIQINESGGTMVYIAIRRPMKIPESGTEVFSPVLYTGGGSSPKTVSGAGFAPDALWQLIRTGTPYSPRPYDKLRGTKQIMSFNSQSAEYTDNNVYSLTNDGAEVGSQNNNSGINYATYFFKRAPSFFDIVCYNGDGAATKTITHGLGVTPELAIVKRRNISDFWAVAHKDYLPSYNGVIDSTNGFVYDASRYIQNLASSTFRVGTYDEVNASGSTYVAYLYVTLAGVSKVGSYTGTGSNIDVDCGFSAGARFILIKGGSGGNWYVWDSARGIVAGNDPYQVLNSAANDVTSTDYIDPLSSGFTVTSSAPADMNTIGDTYIFLAIA